MSVRFSKSYWISRCLSVYSQSLWKRNIFTYIRCWL